MCNGGPQPHEDDAAPSIPDVRDLSVDAVLRADDSALSKALRRVVADMQQADESYAAHGSSPVS
jgi:hypothetical protein